MRTKSSLKSVQPRADDTPAAAPPVNAPAGPEPKPWQLLAAFGGAAATQEQQSQTLGPMDVDAAAPAASEHATASVGAGPASSTLVAAAHASIADDSDRESKEWWMPQPHASLDDAHVEFRPAQPLAESLSCVLCHELLKEAITATECGHCYCYDCIDSRIRIGGRSNLCPVCNSLLGPNPFEHNKLKFDFVLDALVRKVFPRPLLDVALDARRSEREETTREIKAKLGGRRSSATLYASAAADAANAAAASSAGNDEEHRLLKPPAAGDAETSASDAIPAEEGPAAKRPRIDSAAAATPSAGAAAQQLQQQQPFVSIALFPASAASSSASAKGQASNQQVTDAAGNADTAPALPGILRPYLRVPTHLSLHQLLEWLQEALLAGPQGVKVQGLALALGNQKLDQPELTMHTLHCDMWLPQQAWAQQEVMVLHYTAEHAEPVEPHKAAAANAAVAGTSQQQVEVNAQDEEAGQGLPQQPASSASARVRSRKSIPVPAYTAEEQRRAAEEKAAAAAAALAAERAAAAKLAPEAADTGRPKRRSRDGVAAAVMAFSDSVTFSHSSSYGKTGPAGQLPTAPGQERPPLPPGNRSNGGALGTMPLGGARLPLLAPKVPLPPPAGHDKQPTGSHMCSQKGAEHGVYPGKSTEPLPDEAHPLTATPSWQGSEGSLHVPAAPAAAASGALPAHGAGPSSMPQMPILQLSTGNSSIERTGSLGSQSLGGDVLPVHGNGSVPAHAQAAATHQPAQSQGNDSTTGVNEQQEKGTAPNQAAASDSPAAGSEPLQRLPSAERSSRRITRSSSPSATESSPGPEHSGDSAAQNAASAGLAAALKSKAQRPAGLPKAPKPRPVVPAVSLPLDPTANPLRKKGSITPEDHNSSFRFLELSAKVLAFMAEGIKFERAVRELLGNNPDVSKVLRHLAANGYVERLGQGGRTHPFSWRITEEGKASLQGAPARSASPAAETASAEGQEAQQEGQQQQEEQQRQRRSQSQEPGSQQEPQKDGQQDEQKGGQQEEQQGGAQGRQKGGQQAQKAALNDSKQANSAATNQQRLGRGAKRAAAGSKDAGNAATANGNVSSDATPGTKRTRSSSPSPGPDGHADKRLTRGASLSQQQQQRQQQPGRVTRGAVAAAQGNAAKK